MLQNKMFYKQLQGFLKEHPEMSWQSDSSGEAIVPVRLAWHRLYDRTKLGMKRWEQEADGQAERRLSIQSGMDVDTMLMWQLKEMFMGHPAGGKQLISIKRAQPDQTDQENPSAFDLYILARFGWWYVGIKTTLIET
jgi:hypothetical protein